MRVLVTGSRDWQDAQVVLRALDAIRNRPLVVVHGGAHGVDAIASRWAKAHKVEEDSHPPDYDTYGDLAPGIRNEQMVQLGADVCMAFIRDYSGGATGTSERAVLAGIPTLVWYELTPGI